MITSFFNKSKPNNYIIIFLMALLAFIIAVFKYNTLPFTVFNSFKLLLNFSLVYFSILLLNFIVKRNDLSKDNTFVVLIYVLGLLLVPQIFLNIKIICANLLVLLALRRLFSLYTKKNSIKKLFDFGLLVAIAFLFNKWAISSFVLVFIALLFYAERPLNYWIIPFLGVLSVSILTYTSYLYIPNLLPYSDIIFYYKWLDIAIYNWKLKLAVILLLVFVFYTLIHYIPSIKQKKRIKQPVFYLVIYVLFMVVFITIIQPIKTGSELLFCFTPLAIIGANALEHKKIKWINEIFIAIAVLSAIIFTLF